MRKKGEIEREGSKKEKKEKGGGREVQKKIKKCSEILFEGLVFFFLLLSSFLFSPKYLYLFLCVLC